MKLGKVGSKMQGRAELQRGPGSLGGVSGPAYGSGARSKLHLGRKRKLEAGRKNYVAAGTEQEVNQGMF